MGAELTGICISGWDSTCQPYIESATALSDIIYLCIYSFIGERAKRVRHSQVCSIENRIYIYILEKWFPLWGERAHSMKLFCM